MLFLSLFLRLLFLVTWCDAFAPALAQLQGEVPVRQQLPNSAKRFSFWAPFPLLRRGYATCLTLQCAVCAWVIWLLTLKTTAWESFALLLSLTWGFTQIVYPVLIWGSLTQVTLLGMNLVHHSLALSSVPSSPLDSFNYFGMFIYPRVFQSCIRELGSKLQWTQVKTGHRNLLDMFKNSAQVWTQERDV